MSNETDKQYKTVYVGGEGEIVEKKSRFIATVIPCEDEETALSFIEATKKKYWDARHNCSAYTVGFNHELERCSDDGEPQKTAGRPMLDVLLNEGIHNVCVVVTRYFGGVLLGTGGLVRAYQAAVKEGLKNSTVITKQYGKKIKIVTDYNGIGKIQSALNGEIFVNIGNFHRDDLRDVFLYYSTSAAKIQDFSVRRMFFIYLHSFHK